MIITSIDVGYKGGIAKHLIEHNRNIKLLDIYKMPTITTERKVKGKIKKKYNIDIPNLLPILQDSSVIIIEDVHSMPKEGVVSAFNFGYQKGLLTGLSVGIVGYNNVFFVNPRTWKSYFKLPKNKKYTIDFVRNSYNINLEDKDDGIADAILIGLYFIKTTINVD
jgi:hypothetical protein